MKKNTILIMGGNGFLGSYLYDHLQKIKKYKLFKQSRKSFADVTFNPNNKKELFKNLETIKPNIIINLISCTELDKCEANVEYTINTNIGILENISSFVRFNKKIYFINISTDQLYSLKGRNDEDCVFPINFYAISKFLGEKYVLESGGCNLRVNFIGRNLKSKSFLDWAYFNLMKNKRINGYNNIEFNPLSVEKLCELIIEVIEKKLKGNFNIGSDGKITKYQVLKIFEKKLGKKKLVKKSKYNNKKNLLLRPENMVMSNLKLKKYLKLRNNSIQKNVNRALQKFHA